MCTIVLRKDDQDLLDSDCNTALHIATLEKTGHKLKLNVIQELIGIRCSPHKKNSQNKLAIDNLTKDKDTKSKKCLQKYMDETEGIFNFVFILHVYIYNIDYTYSTLTLHNENM